MRRKTADLDSWFVTSETTTKNTAVMTGEPPSIRACNAENQETRKLKLCQQQPGRGSVKVVDLLAVVAVQ